MEEEVFFCDKCTKQFTTKFSLNRHQFIHSQVKKYMCKFCPKKFALKQYLKEHECIHTNSRPYVCGVNGCTQRFRQRGKLSLHRRKHKGYKMKEYVLIRNSEDCTEEISETSSFENRPHQNIRRALNENSENSQEESSQDRDKVRSKLRRRTAKAEDKDTDSEFELPARSIKSKYVEGKRSLRNRKMSLNSCMGYTENNSEDGVSVDLEDEKRDESLTPNQQNNLTLLRIPVSSNKFRKVSNASTEGSQFEYRLNNSKMATSTFRKKAGNSTSNFEVLVKAFKICNKISPAQPNFEEVKNKCEESKMAERNFEKLGESSQTCTPVNEISRILLLSGLNSCRNGADVNNSFDLIRSLLASTVNME